jgi:2-oxoglutarate ferredoxin oxidoreductase subunit delta
MKHGKPTKLRTTEFISINTHLCQACWECVEACPNNVLGKVNILFHKHVRIDQADKCQGCGICVDTCQNQAITSLD